jgi:hypothetical protein
LSHIFESSKLPFTVMIPLGPGILSTRWVYCHKM